MTFKHHQTKFRTPVFRNQNVAYWQWPLPIICEIAVIFTSFSLARILPTHGIIALRSAKIALSDFELNKSSNTFYDRAKSISLSHPIQSIPASLQFIVAGINFPAGKLSG